MFPLISTAENTEAYYQAAVPVKSQAASERRAAAASGLEAVIYRLTGIQIASSNPIVKNALKNALKNAERFLEQFRYAELSNPSLDENTAQLVMQFSPQLISQLFAEANIRFWPLNRPRVLVWLVEDTVEDGRVLSNDLTSEVLLGLQERAKVRGVPLHFPLLDLDDQIALPADRVWMMDEEAVVAASERYKADTILVGRYSQTSIGEWFASWQYYHREDSGVFDERSMDASILGLEVVDGLADYLIERYAVHRTLEATPRISIALEGVDGFQSYSAVLGYFEGLAVVSSFELGAIESDLLMIDAEVVGGVSQLTNALSLDDKVSIVDQGDTQASLWERSQVGTRDMPLLLRWGL